MSLSVTWPSGDVNVAGVRRAILGNLANDELHPTCTKPVLAIVHQATINFPIPLDTVYIGDGHFDALPRPSQWAATSVTPFANTRY